MRIFSLLTLILLASLGCHHSPKNSKLSDNWTPLSGSKYKNLLRKNTKSHKEYQGLNLSFEAHLVFKNSKILDNQLKMIGQYKNWERNKALDEKTKLTDQNKKTSSFFLSFYSPNRKRNKLDQTASDWRIILRTSEGELPGEIKFTDNISNHNSVFYPTLERWGKFYSVSFPISTENLENKKFEVVLMGPEGSASFQF